MAEPRPPRFFDEPAPARDLRAPDARARPLLRSAAAEAAKPALGRPDTASGQNSATPRVFSSPSAPAPSAAMPHEGTRLNKRLAELGLCSRREADQWIARGWVYVNGAVAQMGVRVLPTDRVTVERAAQREQAERVTILLNKPMGYVSGQAEDGHEPAVVLVTPRSHWRDDPSARRFSPPQLRGLAPAGRLDIDSVGLLVLTQDGRVARQLIGEDSSVDKEYLVRVVYEGDTPDLAARTGERAAPLMEINEGDPVRSNVQAVFPQERLERLRHGLSLDGKPLLPAKVEWQNPEQLRFVLVEGKKRQIRRMCEQVGLKVVGLKRIRIGGVVLGNLPAGQWRYLGANERF